MFYLGLADAKVVSAIEITRVIIIIENVFLIPSAVRVKVVLNILNW